jgi:hypothetical protein
MDVANEVNINNRPLVIRVPFFKRSLPFPMLATCKVLKLPAGKGSVWNQGFLH